MNQTPSSRRLLHALIVLCTVLLLGACSVLEKPRRPVVFDFGPGPRTQMAFVGMADRPAIRLGDVDAASAFDSTAMLYRLAYADGQQLLPYALARWSMAPAQLLRQRLRDALGQQHLVLRDGDGIRPGARPVRLLQIELEEFSQVFDAPDASVGLLRVLATVLQPTGNGDQLLAQRNFVAQVPAASADAAGGVRALSTATDLLGADISQWLKTLR